MDYDCIIVGAGPAGIFTALELIKLNPGHKILLIEKGNPIEKRRCPKRSGKPCAHCSPCNITTGFSGAGAFSDGKLVLSSEVGGTLNEYLDEEALAELITYVDDIYLGYGADRFVYGENNSEIISNITNKAIQSNIKFVHTRIRHIGTEKSYELYTHIQNNLKARGVAMLFNTPVEDIIIEEGRVRGVIAGNEYRADVVVAAVGREGADWLNNTCAKAGVSTEPGTVDIGVRVEVRNEVMDDVNKSLYESKLIYYTPTFDDRVRTFCQNPSGVVAPEYYADDLAVVNGHSYKSDEYKTENTNFALLVSSKFTEPFKQPIEYGKYIARLGNLLSGNKIIVQRFGDFKRGRRTTHSRIERNNIKPTLKSAIPGDLSLVLPYRIMLDIKEMLEALNNIFPGLTSDETLMYGVEVKFYSNKVMVNKSFESELKGFYVAGDGAGITRGLLHASINGVAVARVLSKRG